MASKKSKGRYKLSWEQKPVKYNHFTDMGNYLVIQKDQQYADIALSLKLMDEAMDTFVPRCTCTAKINKKGEVIMGRNMDVEISQCPAIVTRIVGGKYNAFSFFYGGANAKYHYDELDQLDMDAAYLLRGAFSSTDAMNEAGLYAEVNMREMDDQFNPYCSGTNPGRPRACLVSAPILIAANCATVPEALDFLRNSFDWYTLGFFDKQGGHSLLWNLAIMIGDAEGNYGLVEFADNEILYTPYCNGQANYYIHPLIAEYADQGAGFGRLAAAFKGMTGCETEEDMLHNMESCMWRKEILEPGSLGYSDFETSLLLRRSIPQDVLQNIADAKMKPLQELAKEFYSGNEKPLRDNGSVWTTGFNIGVNCKKKHLILRLWENDGAIFDLKW